MAHPATAGVPVVVETPTEKHDGHAADIATPRQRLLHSLTRTADRDPGA